MQYAGRFRSGVTDQFTYFERPAGFSSFTVGKSRNGSAWSNYTTPTITEQTFSGDQSVYKFLLDEDMDVDSGNISEVVALRISAPGMQTVYLWIELYIDDVTHVNGGRIGEGGTAPPSPLGYV